MLPCMIRLTPQVLDPEAAILRRLAGTRNPPFIHLQREVLFAPLVERSYGKV